MTSKVWQFGRGNGTVLVSGGRWVISGPFLLWGNITHVLKEVGQTTPVVVPGQGYWSHADVVEHSFGGQSGPNAAITGSHGRLHSMRSGVDVLRGGVWKTCDSRPGRMIPTRQEKTR